MSNVLHKELSYTLNGILFSVHNNLGKYASEKQVCDHLEEELKQHGLLFLREASIPTIEVQDIGRHRVDFLIENKIVLEIKYKRFLQRDDYIQVMRYLKALNLALGILVNFRAERLYPKRVLNGSGKE